MNKLDKLKVKAHAQFLLKEWAFYEKRASESDNPAWYELGRRQALRDSLTSLKYLGFIKDFELPDKIIM